MRFDKPVKLGPYIKNVLQLAQRAGARSLLVLSDEQTDSEIRTGMKTQGVSLRKMEFDETDIENTNLRSQVVRIRKILVDCEFSYKELKSEFDAYRKIFKWNRNHKFDLLFMG